MNGAPALNDGVGGTQTPENELCNSLLRARLDRHRPVELFELGLRASGLE
jgi:hypothetical protein